MSMKGHQRNPSLLHVEKGSLDWLHYDPILLLLLWQPIWAVYIHVGIWAYIRPTPEHRPPPRMRGLGP